MPNYNKVILMGNLTRDPDMRYTRNDTAVANFGMAVNRKFKGEEETTFVDCTAWGKVAETISQYLRKGKPIMVDGRLTLDQWQNQEGQNRSKLLVTVENFQFIGDGDEGSRERADSPPPSQSPSQAETVPAEDPDDIPF